MTGFNSRGLAHDNLPSGGLSGSNNHTGFAYYNFDLQQWDEIGVWDPATGNDIKPTQFYVEKSGTDQWLPKLFGWSGKDSETVLQPTDTGGDDLPLGWQETGGGYLKRYQFGMSNHLGFRAGTYDDLITLGYQHIGTPTLSGEAPFESTYHAASSNTLSMSDYISHPFVLEKAVLEIPVTVRRMNGSRHPQDVTAAHAVPLGKLPMKLRMDGSVRDIDNYTFFMYRQSKVGNHIVDSTKDVTGSQRFLVMSASAAFWNGPTFNAEVSSSIVSLGLPHSPAFSHDFNLPVSASQYFGDTDGSDNRVSTGLSMVSEYTGTLRLEMVPAVASGKRGGGSRFFMRALDQDAAGGVDPSPYAATLYNNIVVQDFWPGGTTVDKVSLSPSLVQDRPHRTHSSKYKGLGTQNCKGAFFKEYPPFSGDRQDEGYGITGSIASTIFQDGRALRNPLGIRNYKGDILGATALTSSALIDPITTCSWEWKVDGASMTLSGEKSRSRVQEPIRCSQRSRSI